MCYNIRLLEFVLLFAMLSLYQFLFKNKIKNHRENLEWVPYNFLSNSPNVDTSGLFGTANLGPSYKYGLCARGCRPVLPRRNQSYVKYAMAMFNPQSQPTGLDQIKEFAGDSLMKPATRELVNRQPLYPHTSQFTRASSVMPGGHGGSRRQAMQLKQPSCQCRCRSESNHLVF